MLKAEIKPGTEYVSCGKSARRVIHYGACVHKHVRIQQSSATDGHGRMMNQRHGHPANLLLTARSCADSSNAAWPGASMTSNADSGWPAHSGRYRRKRKSAQIPANTAAPSQWLLRKARRHPSPSRSRMRY